MRTSDVADRAGVNVQTLRYYERRGLLDEPPRSSAGYRVYPAEVVTVVRFIKRAEQLGFSLTQVAELLHLAEGGPESGEQARAHAAAWMAVIEAKIADLRQLQDSYPQTNTLWS